jgi:hypothetical protein
LARMHHYQDLRAAYKMPVLKDVTECIDIEI